MKKILFFLVAAMAIVLAGCGSTSVSKEDVVSKALNAKINSAEVTGKVDVKLGSNGENTEQSIDLSVKYSDDPFLTYVKMGTVEGDIEMYLDKDNAYMFIPGMDGWMKTPTSDTAELAELAEGQSIQEDLDKLEKFEDLFTFESVEDGYELKVQLKEDATEEEFALVQEVLKDSIQDVQYEDIKINAFDYTLTLDKEYLLTSALAKLDLEVTAEGEKVQMATTADVKYTNVNKLKDFTIPTEVSENAMDVSE
ncbi:hypothetical protein EKG37_07310 [Robertmurraya yapensis]|uniref:Outer membrane lipoprotein carrier protein LolA n=1 Tax=Bacillus yapensis TaxID=2492960 RepID=A0A431WEQ4_9BACI|nr:DUF6612 family protein [Bacillus yapensis]RTR34012.1 hypothetical protein EKG37_07310 [Bacillus yapensis]TKS97330.1 hypothetical protein FAR12_07310 [Bacillus yapensis]